MEKKRQVPCNACIPIVYESDGGAYNWRWRGRYNNCTVREQSEEHIIADLQPAPEPIV